MFHACLWSAIDKLAAKNNMTCSALARRSGLDPTTFNKCKRHTRNGQPHYPSMKSVEKILAATGTTMADFAEMMSDASHSQDREKEK